MLLGLVQEDARRLVAREGVVLIAVPQALDDVDELAGPLVALAVLEVLVATIVPGGALQAGGHYVPSRAALADMVQRAELPGDVVGLPIRSGQGADETDLRGRDRQGRQQGQRLQAVEEMRGGVGRDERAVDDEHQVELGGLGQPGVVDVPVDVDAGVAGQGWVAPARVICADARQDRAEFQLPGRLLRHGRALKTVIDA